MTDPTKSKTIMASVAAAVGAMAGAVAGEIGWYEAIMLILGAAIMIFQRLGTQKAIDAVSKKARAFLPLLLLPLFLAGGCRVSPEAKAASAALVKDFPVLARNVEPRADLSPEKKEQVKALLDVMHENVRRLDKEINK